MFETVATPDLDPILGLAEAFACERNPDKIDLGVGVLRDLDGGSAPLRSVRLAEQRVLDADRSKAYVVESPGFGRGVQALLFGEGCEVLASQRVQTAQTPGSTAALRVAAELIQQQSPGATVWISEPTWDNHARLFGAAGLRTRSYPYYDRHRHRIAFEQLRRGLAEVGAGNVVLFQGCCHNPSGADPSLEEWRELAQLAAARRFTALFDVAYQGLGTGLTEDVAGLRLFAEHVGEMLVASSFSKNMGLYKERVGALSVLAPSASNATAMFARMQHTIRAHYSFPPAYGGSVAALVLGDADLRRLWEEELAGIRARLRAARGSLVAAIDRYRAGGDFDFVLRQQGFFSLLGLSEAQTEALRVQHAVYMPRSGRINISGINSSNSRRIAAAIVAVL